MNCITCLSAGPGSTPQDSCGRQNSACAVPGGHAMHRQLRRVLRHRSVHGGAVGQACAAGQHARHPLALQLMLREGHHLARTGAPARCLQLCLIPSVLPCSLTSRRGGHLREHGPTFQGRPMSASEGHAGGNTCWYRGTTLQCSRTCSTRALFIWVSDVQQP